MKQVLVACPITIAWGIVHNYMDTEKWKVTEVDLSTSVIASKRRGMFGGDMILGASLTADGPHQTVVSILTGYEKTAFFAGGGLENELADFEAAIKRGVKAATSSGQVSANQWRPSV